MASLLNLLLHHDPTKRLGANGAADVKGHAWFAGTDWSRLLDGDLPSPLQAVAEVQLAKQNLAEGMRPFLHGRTGYSGNVMRLHLTAAIFRTWF